MSLIVIKEVPLPPDTKTENAFKSHLHFTYTGLGMYHGIASYVGTNK